MIALHGLNVNPPYISGIFWLRFKCDETFGDLQVQAALQSLPTRWFQVHIDDHTGNFDILC